MHIQFLCAQGKTETEEGVGQIRVAMAEIEGAMRALLTQVGGRGSAKSYIYLGLARTVHIRRK